MRTFFLELLARVKLLYYYFKNLPPALFPLFWKNFLTKKLRDTFLSKNSLT